MACVSWWLDVPGTSCINSLFDVFNFQGATLNEFIVLKLDYQTVTALLANVSFAEHYKTFMYTHHLVTVSIIF